MEKRRPRWKDYILAVILAVALLYAIFPIKGLLKLMTALYWRYILYGVAGGVAVSVVLYLLKKRAVIFFIALVLLVLWTILPAGEPGMSLVFGCGALCWLGSIPFLASLLCKI